MKLLKKILFFFTKWFTKHVIEEVGGDSYCVQYENESYEKANCVLFGFNVFNDPESNFGSNENVKVKELHSLMSYGEAIEKVANEPFKIGIMRVQSTNQESLLKTVMIKRTIDANGVRTARPHVLLNSLDIYQMQSNILDVNVFKNCTIDGSTWFDFELGPQSTIVISIYPLVSRLVSYSEYRDHVKKYNPSPFKFCIHIDAIEWIGSKLKKLFRIK